MINYRDLYLYNRPVGSIWKGVQPGVCEGSWVERAKWFWHIQCMFDCTSPWPSGTLSFIIYFGSYSMFIQLVLASHACTIARKFRQKLIRPGSSQGCLRSCYSRMFWNLDALGLILGHFQAHQQPPSTSWDLTLSVCCNEHENCSLAFESLPDNIHWIINDS